MQEAVAHQPPHLGVSPQVEADEADGDDSQPLAIQLLRKEVFTIREENIILRRHLEDVNTRLCTLQDQVATLASNFSVRIQTLEYAQLQWTQQLEQQQQQQQQHRQQQQPPSPPDSPDMVAWTEVLGQALKTVESLECLTPRQRKALEDLAIHILLSEFPGTNIAMGSGGQRDVKLPPAVFRKFIEEVERKVRTGDVKGLELSDFKIPPRTARRPVKDKRPRSRSDRSMSPSRKDSPRRPNQHKRSRRDGGSDSGEFEPISKRTRSRSRRRRFSTSPPRHYQLATGSKFWDERQPPLGSHLVKAEDPIRRGSHSRDRSRSPSPNRRVGKSKQPSHRRRRFDSSDTEEEERGRSRYSRRGQYRSRSPATDKINSRKRAPSIHTVEPSPSREQSLRRTTDNVINSESAARPHITSSAALPEDAAPPQTTSLKFVRDPTAAKPTDFRPPGRVCIDCRIKSCSKWIEVRREGYGLTYLCFSCSRRRERVAGRSDETVGKVDYEGRSGRARSRSRVRQS
ncbi:hypothetical protein HDU67_007947 [Dinochytrium kinnereticum]|nr:hypothetical protein HDU67_007947 [Dinochytrium kinnereticum]